MEDTAARLRSVLFRLERRLRAKELPYDLTPTQCAVLAAIATEGSPRLSDVAEQVGLSAPTMSRLVETLTDRRLVTRRPDATDHRAARLALSAAGKAQLLAATERRTKILADCMADLAPDDVEALTAAIPALEALEVAVAQPR